MSVRVGSLCAAQRSGVGAETDRGMTTFQFGGA